MIVKDSEDNFHLSFESNPMNYAIGVSFCERNYWSKPYTYLHSSELIPGEIVVVPTGNFFSIGKVINSKSLDTFKLDPKINYKQISIILKDLK